MGKRKHVRQKQIMAAIGSDPYGKTVAAVLACFPRLAKTFIAMREHAIRVSGEEDLRFQVKHLKTGPGFADGAIYQNGEYEDLRKHPAANLVILVYGIAIEIQRLRGQGGFSVYS